MQDSGLQMLFQGNNLWRLFQRLLVTASVSLLSIVASTVFGFLFGFIMASRFRIVHVSVQIYLEFIRITSRLILLFLVYFNLAQTFNLSLSGEAAALTAFSMWGITEMDDLVRGALASLPKHRFESELALGLTKTQLLIYIIIPQVLWRLLPQAVNLITRMIRTTSLTVLIGVMKVVEVGQQVIETNYLTIPSAAIWVYGLIFLVYFAVCFPILRLSMYLEKVWREQSS